MYKNYGYPRATTYGMKKETPSVQKYPQRPVAQPAVNVAVEKQHAESATNSNLAYYLELDKTVREAFGKKVHNALEFWANTPGVKLTTEPANRGHYGPC